MGTMLCIFVDPCFSLILVGSHVTSGLAVSYFLMNDLVVDLVSDVFFQHRTRMLHLVVSKLLGDVTLDITSELAIVELPRVVLG